MKESIKKLLNESLKDKLTSSAKEELDNLVSTHGDIIKKYKELSLLIDKLDYLNDIKYSVHVLKNNNGFHYYSMRVKDPYYDGDENKSKWFTIHVGKKETIDQMNPKERESFFENRAISYLMKKI